MKLFINIFSGMAGSIDPDQTTPEGAVWSGSAMFAYVNFVKNLGVQNFRSFTIISKIPSIC